MGTSNLFFYKEEFALSFGDIKRIEEDILFQIQSVEVFNNEDSE
jgi:hypothetical protein